MTDDPKNKKRDNRQCLFLEHIREKEQRKLRSQQNGKQDIWFFLGFFGLVGWTVAVPMVLGVFFGLWLDHLAHTSGIWTLAGLLAGLAVGLLNAWLWLKRQGNSIQKEREP